MMIPTPDNLKKLRLTRAQAAARVCEAIYLVLEQIGSPVDAPTNALAIELEKFAISLEEQ